MLIGTAGFLTSQDIDPAPLADKADKLRRTGATAVLVAIDGTPAGVIGIADQVKDTTPAASTALRKEGIEVIMLTGDNQVTAAAVAADLGIDRVEAEVLPDHKADVVNRPSVPRAASSRSPETASTTPLRSPQPTSDWRWAPAPTSPSNLPESPCSAATSTA